MSASAHNYEFRLRLRTTWKRAGFSQRTFAVKSGLSVSTLKAVKQGVMSSPTKDLIVQTLNQSDILKSKITAEWLFEKWQPRKTPTVAAGWATDARIERPTTRRVPPEAMANCSHPLTLPDSKLRLEDLPLPDLLTPGEPMSNLIEIYAPRVGIELARALADLSKDAIASVELGDFKAQTSIGLRIARTARDFPEISGVGEYLAGEGFRLQADLETDLNKTALLYEESAARYRRASEVIPYDPRPVRGIARISERHERFDAAETGFSRAEGLVLVNKTTPGGMMTKRALDHEHLRVARHKIHCLLDIREAHRSSTWNRANRFHELYGLVTQCDNLHHELMGHFKAQKAWWQIEWFMGLVFLAKAWGHLKQHDRTLFCLLNSISIRRQMLSEHSILSQIERSNLQWWIHVALASDDVLTNQFLTSVEQLQTALVEKENAKLVVAIDDLLRPFMPPGERTF